MHLPRRVQCKKKKITTCSRTCLLTLHPLLFFSDDELLVEITFKSKKIATSSVVWSIFNMLGVYCFFISFFQAMCWGHFLWQFWTPVANWFHWCTDASKWSHTTVVKCWSWWRSMDWNVNLINSRVVQEQVVIFFFLFCSRQWWTNEWTYIEGAKIHCRSRSHIMIMPLAHWAVQWGICGGDRGGGG